MEEYQYSTFEWVEDTCKHISLFFFKWWIKLRKLRKILFFSHSFVWRRKKKDGGQIEVRLHWMHFALQIWLWTMWMLHSNYKTRLKTILKPLKNSKMKHMYLFKLGESTWKETKTYQKMRNTVSDLKNLFNNLGNLNTNLIMGNIKDVFNFLDVVMLFWSCFKNDLMLGWNMLRFVSK